MPTMPSLLTKVAGLLCLVMTASASCAHGTFLRPRQEDPVKIRDFGYTRTTGPHNWAALAAENVPCAMGRNQSPIDMTADQFTELAAADVQVQLWDLDGGADFENVGTTVVVVVPGAGALVFAGKTHDLAQLHFHLPSEHLDDGTSHSMEMHMVFQTAARELAVIGTYINVVDGEATNSTQSPSSQSSDRSCVRRRMRRDRPVSATSENGEAALGPSPSNTTQPGPQPADSIEQCSGVGRVATAPTALLETIFHSVEDISRPGTRTRTAALAFGGVLDAWRAGAFRNYAGSLTTPPCSEGVAWLVSTAQLAVSAATFARLQPVVGFNARFVQNTPGEENVLMLAAKTIGMVEAASKSAAGGRKR